jgi:hypothetical protein
MILTDFPVEILLEFFLVLKEISPITDIIRLHVAMYWTSFLMRSKLDFVMRKVELDGGSVLSLKSAGETTNVLEKQILYNYATSFSSNARQNFLTDINSFFKLAAKFPNLKRLECLTTQHSVFPLNTAFVNTNLISLTLNVPIKTTDLMLFPNLRDLYVDQVISSDYTEQFDQIEHLHIYSRRNSPSTPGSRYVDLPYARMFPKLQTLKITSEGFHTGETSVEIANLNFLTNLYVARYWAGLNITIGKLDMLLELTTCARVNFATGTFFPNLTKFEIVSKIFDIDFTNFSANSNLEIEYFLGIQEMCDKQYATLNQVGAKYNLGVFIYPVICPILPPTNITQIVGLQAGHVAQFHQQNPEIFSKLRNLSVFKESRGPDDNDIDASVLRCATSLQSFSAELEDISVDLMSVLVTIPTLRLTCATKKAIELFCDIHASLRAGTQTKLCTEIIVGEHSQRLALYAREANIDYKLR